jgi:hypothetical protein
MFDLTPHHSARPRNWFIYGGRQINVNGRSVCTWETTDDGEERGHLRARFVPDPHLRDPARSAASRASTPGAWRRAGRSIPPRPVRVPLGQQGGGRATADGPRPTWRAGPRLDRPQLRGPWRSDRAWSASPGNLALGGPTGVISCWLAGPDRRRLPRRPGADPRLPDRRETSTPGPPASPALPSPGSTWCGGATRCGQRDRDNRRPGFVTVLPAGDRCPTLEPQLLGARRRRTW